MLEVGEREEKEPIRETNRQELTAGGRWDMMG